MKGDVPVASGRLGGAFDCVAKSLNEFGKLGVTVEAIETIRGPGFLLQRSSSQGLDSVSIQYFALDFASKCKISSERSYNHTLNTDQSWRPLAGLITNLGSGVAVVRVLSMNNLSRGARFYIV
jgi:hypothetical protein